MRTNPIAVALKEHLEEEDDASFLPQEAMEDEAPIIVVGKNGIVHEFENDEL